MLIPKQNRIRSEKHRRFIASLPCCVSGAADVQCAHIRAGCYSAGFKPGDNLCVPLSCYQHDKQGKMGELPFWEQYGGIEKAKELAKALYAISGDREAAIQLLIEFRR